MRVERSFRILPDIEPTVVEALRDNHIKVVPHACEDRVRPYRPDDPYDVIGGDDGAE